MVQPASRQNPKPDPGDKPVAASQHYVVVHDAVGGLLGWTKNRVVRPDDQWVDGSDHTAITAGEYKRLLQIDAIRVATAEEAKAADDAAAQATKDDRFFEGYYITPEPPPEETVVSAVAEEPRTPPKQAENRSR